MLKIYHKGEQRLWQSGIISWKRLLEQTEKHPHFTRKMWKNLREESLECQHALDQCDYDYFLQKFPKDILWRFYPNLKNQILYIDVEMTGLDIKKDTITTIAAFDGNQVYSFIRGKNLEDFPSLAENYSAICTFDGEKSDLPFIEKVLKFQFNHIHFDLYILSRLLSISGGLKQIESRLGIKRNISDGLDGRSAVFFWQMYDQTKEQEYLDALLAYNIEDVLYLPEMLNIFFELLRHKNHLPVKKIPNTKNQVIKSIQLPNISIEVIEEAKIWIDNNF